MESKDIVSAEQLSQSLTKDNNIKFKPKFYNQYKEDEFQLTDICLNLKGQEEDKLFIKNQSYLDKVRRGNTIITKNH